MRASTAIVAGACALLLALGVAGCAETAETPSNTIGPNGYELSGTIEGTDVQVWYDYAEDVNQADIVLMQGTDVVGVCLGGDGTMCIEGNKYDTPYAIFVTPPGATRAELSWGGAAPIPMNLANGAIEEGKSIVWVAAPPPIPEGGLASPVVTAYDDAGTVLATANS